MGDYAWSSGSVEAFNEDVNLVERFVEEGSSALRADC